MPPLVTHTVNDFITLFVVLDPVGLGVPMFLALTADLDPALKRKLAVRSVLVAFAVMLFFIAFAQIIVEAIGLSLRSFQIAGGIILVLFAVSCVLGGEPAAAASRSGERDPMALAVYPLAIPTMCGPGTMLTAMLITDNARFSIFEQAQTAFAGALVLALTLVLLLLAEPVQRAIGSGGANVVRRVMGMMLAAIAVNMVLSGLGSWLSLPKL